MSKEFQKFDETMKAILRADPKAVKAALESEKQANIVGREAKGEQKRGRKPRAKK